VDGFSAAFVFISLNDSNLRFTSKQTNISDLYFYLFDEINANSKAINIAIMYFTERRNIIQTILFEQMVFQILPTPSSQI
jgi:hypothetical protein